HIASGDAERLAESLFLRVGAQSVGQSGESDHAVDDRRRGVADEEIEKGSLGQEAGGGRAGGESEVHGEAIQAEGNRPLLRANEIGDQRVARRPIQFTEYSADERDQENRDEASNLRQ